MNEYLVTWDCVIYADSPQEAAKKALEIQRDTQSIAVYFHVEDLHTQEEVDVDLLEEEE